MHKALLLSSLLLAATLATAATTQLTQLTGCAAKRQAISTQIEQAKAVCRECGVSTQCLEYAIKENQDTGVWGGLSEDERKSLKRKYARARRAG